MTTRANPTPADLSFSGSKTLVKTFQILVLELGSCQWLSSHCVWWWGRGKRNAPPSIPCVVPQSQVLGVHLQQSSLSLSLSVSVSVSLSLCVCLAPHARVPDVSLASLFNRHSVLVSRPERCMASEGKPHRDRVR